ncbi:secreted RxLR effector protein 161-like [Lycium barbarum]|uniref:secreted RxLR effector protein 161-like n=1 Tax=Lycium barbarum TaxID=112863 RepID=UPI00293EF563|nr:secreted RxLR effector protein 161-like [Lycium barbarum]
MFDCKPISTPFAAHFKLSVDSCPKSEEDIERMCTIPYASVVGNLMYAMVCTRPDLAFVVSMVSRYMPNLVKDHWNAVKWILRYVKGSVDIGLVFDRDKASSYDVVGFVNSDYGGDLDHMRSIFGYIFSLCSGAISWKAQLQSIAALSTIEAEYIIATEGVKEATLLREVFLLILVFNRADSHCSKTKHINVKYHFIRDTIAAGEIVVKKVYMSENPIDMLTKLLAITKFKHCLDLVDVLHA